jgi:glutamyl-tRNA(Gln) amidotransferase subunit E
VAIDPEKIGLKVGFEIHQQLATKSKLFCNCSCKETEEYGSLFIRKLRPTQSELGVYDPAALFEFKRARTVKYRAAMDASCLVEADEEPPHDVNREALDIALIISLALHSKITDEVHVMRKIVIDGSNTSGFQRTMLIATGGYININDKKRVGIQSICLEEDAAKLISDDGLLREYGLDRLGIPLIEIALEPVTGTSEEIMQIALAIGMLLRASKRVVRGLGSIRQDVNVSVDNGAIVEVKGVQQLDQLVNVIEYEMLRQHGLILIAQKIKNGRKPEEIEIGIGDRIEDITNLLSKSSSKVVKKCLIDNKCVFKAIRVKGFAGIMGFEPYPDIRLGKQLSELARFYGLGGIFHSDELPGYDITEHEINVIKKRLEISSLDDAFIIIGGPNDKVESAVDAIVQRLKAALNGVPPETRAATLDGKTIFSRPRPGAARMYPETDIFPIPIDRSLLNSLAENLPKSMDEIINIFIHKYGLNKKLAIQIFDSPYLHIFEEIVRLTKIQPTFIVSKLTEDLINLERQGLDVAVLTDNIILDTFKRLDEGSIAKESVILIFEKLAKKEVNTIDEAILELGISSVKDEELRKVLDKIIEDNMPIILQKKMESINMLMGRSMAVLRGKVDGKKINLMLKKRLQQLLTSISIENTDRNEI